MSSTSTACLCSRCYFSDPQCKLVAGFEERHDSWSSPWTNAAHSQVCHGFHLVLGAMSLHCCGLEYLPHSPEPTHMDASAGCSCSRQTTHWSYDLRSHHASQQWRMAGMETTRFFFIDQFPMNIPNKNPYRLALFLGPVPLAWLTVGYPEPGRNHRCAAGWGFHCG